MPLILVLALGLALDPTPRFAARAHLVAERLEVGDQATLVVELDTDLPLGGDARRPVLQIGAPASIELIETIEADPDRRSRGDWLALTNGHPWGRVLEAPRVEIPLRVIAPLDPDATLDIHLMTYVDGATEQDARFVRRLLVQPLVAGAKARESDELRSRWGRGDLVHVGDRAANFDVPRGGGERLVLSQELGRKRPIFLLTYRSDW